MTGDGVEDERDIELSSITAIFPELQLSTEYSHAATLELKVSPSTPLLVIFTAPLADLADEKQQNGLPTPPSSDDSHEGNQQIQARPVVNTAPDIHLLSYLPSLQLDIVLPNGYPDEVPPRFKLSTKPDWLPPSVLESLQSGGQNLWEEYGRSQTVYTYIDFLQQEAERGFGLADAAGWELPHTLKVELLAHDRQAKRECFEQETFDCGVCLEPKKGSVCYRLERCGHVFCVGCLQDFYNSAISEGDISSVKCLAPDCGRENMTVEERRKKKQRTLHPRELLAIPLDKSQIQRYVNLKRKKKLESDKSTIYCPRKWCQGPARSAKYAKYDTCNFADFPDSDSESDEPNEPPLLMPNTNVATTSKTSTNRAPPPDRLSICSICAFAFCRLCQRSWHGEHINCLPRSTTELTDEEKASYDYIRLHTSPCPTCSSPCQKTHGCNHMRCFQCGSHFCYLCSSWLHPGDPYLHYNQRDKGCYMRLWELEEGDEGPREDGHAQFVGARGAEAAEAAHLAAAEAMQAEEFAALEDGAAGQGAEAPAVEGRFEGVIRHRIDRLPANEQFAQVQRMLRFEEELQAEITELLQRLNGRPMVQDEVEDARRQLEDMRVRRAVIWQGMG